MVEMASERLKLFIPCLPTGDDPRACSLVMRRIRHFYEANTLEMASERLELFIPCLPIGDDPRKLDDRRRVGMILGDLRRSKLLSLG